MLSGSLPCARRNELMRFRTYVASSVVLAPIGSGSTAGVMGGDGSTPWKTRTLKTANPEVALISIWYTPRPPRGSVAEKRFPLTDRGYVFTVPRGRVTMSSGCRGTDAEP